MSKFSSRLDGPCSPPISLISDKTSPPRYVKTWGSSVAHSPYPRSKDEQKIKAEAKAEGKCASYNLGRMGSQAHEAGTARCNSDREKLRAGGIRLADTCPKCSKGTSQLVKSLEAADK